MPRFGYQEINTPKLDWQINSKEHLSVLAHRLRWDSPGGVQTSTSADYARDTFGNDFVKLDYGVAKLTSLVTNNMSNEVLYQYSRELLPETQQALTPYTKQYLIGNGVTVNNSIPEVAMDTSEGFNLGSPYYSYRLANPEEWKWQVGDIFYWNKGNHSFKFGVDELHNYDFNNTYGGDGNGYFSYSYVGNYISDQISAASGKLRQLQQQRCPQQRRHLPLLWNLYTDFRPACLWHCHHGQWRVWPGQLEAYPALDIGTRSALGLRGSPAC